MKVDKTILREIAMNNCRLECCDKHEFDTDNFSVGDRYIRCKKCGGKMSPADALQYVLGFIAAGGNPREVWAEFYGPGDSVVVRCPNCLGLEGKETCMVCNGQGFVPKEIGKLVLEGIDNRTH